MVLFFKTVVRKDVSEPCDLSRDLNLAGKQAMTTFRGEIHQAEEKAFTHIMQYKACLVL